MKKFFNRFRSIKGFTLIELLVVIAIIALLASIILASLNTARSKARDATREQSLQEMAKALAVADTDPAPTLAVCTGANADVSTCTGTVSGGVTTAFPTSWAGYKDPSDSAVVCTTGGPPAGHTSCQYVIGKNTLATAAATTQAYEICSYLENSVTIGAYTGRVISVSYASNTGVIGGCN